MLNKVDQKLNERLNELDKALLDIGEMMDPMETKCGIHGLRLSKAENAMYDMLWELQRKAYKAKEMVELDIRVREYYR